MPDISEPNHRHDLHNFGRANCTHFTCIYTVHSGNGKTAVPNSMQNLRVGI